MKKRRGDEEVRETVVKDRSVSILGASHPLDKTTLQSKGDSRTFSNQKCAQNMHKLSLSIAADDCRQLSQCGQ